MIGPWSPSTTARFAHAARTLADEAAPVVGARGPELPVPAPTRRRRSDAAPKTRRRGRPVRLRERPWPAVLADMIEGVVATNQLAPPAAMRARTDLWELVTGVVAEAA